MSLTEKLIVNAAITGCVVNKSDTPYLPVTKAEIVDCAKQLRDIGVSIIHIHARNADGSPCFNAEAYCELVNDIRESCGDIICSATTSGRHCPDIDKRTASLASKPELASLTMGSMNFITGPSINSPETIQEIARRIYKAGAIPELEVFDTGFVHYAGYLIKKGILKPPYYFNIIAGSLGTAPFDLIGLGHMINMLPEGATWAIGGLGRYQLDANVTAIASGGHVRVGLEDNIYFDRERSKLADNIQMASRIIKIAKEMGRDPATPSEAREIIGLSNGG